MCEVYYDINKRKRFFLKRTNVTFPPEKNETKFKKRKNPKQLPAHPRPPGCPNKLRGQRGHKGDSSTAWPRPPSGPFCHQPQQGDKSTWDSWEHRYLLFELGEGLLSRCADDIMDFRDLVQLVGAREEGLQTGRV